MASKLSPGQVAAKKERELAEEIARAIATWPADKHAQVIAHLLAGKVK